MKFKSTCAVLALSVAMPLAAGAEVLKASHQFPGGKGDARDEMMQMIAKDVADAGVDLEIRVYPGESLYKAKEQWSALTSGQLDMTSFPLDYAAGRVPQFSVTLMPGLVRNHERAARLNDSPFMDTIHKLIEDDQDIAILVLAAGSSKEGPGPLVASIAGKGAAFPIPVTVVPMNLSDQDIDSLA